MADPPEAALFQALLEPEPIKLGADYLNALVTGNDIRIEATVRVLSVDDPDAMLNQRRIVSP
jgi:hypothetical protein